MDMWITLTSYHTYPQSQHQQPLRKTLLVLPNFGPIIGGHFQFIQTRPWEGEVDQSARHVGSYVAGNLQNSTWKGRQEQEAQKEAEKTVRKEMGVSEEDYLYSVYDKVQTIKNDLLQNKTYPDPDRERYDLRYGARLEGKAPREQMDELRQIVRENNARITVKNAIKQQRTLDSSLPPPHPHQGK